MDNTRTIKLVGAARFASARFPQDTILQRGETIELKDTDAEALLSETFTDGLGNEHSYFEEISAGQQKETTAQKPARRTRGGQ